MSIIKTENLNYIYSYHTPFEISAIKDINIQINENEFVGIIGHTGSGKSTLVQHFNGLIKPSSGNVLIEGVNIWDKGYDILNLRFKVGLVFQYPEYQLFDSSVAADIAFGPRNMGLDEAQIEERVRFAAKIVGLDEDLLNKSPFDLSGGQKRRAALAGVLAMQPKILILDEPTAGLDPIGRDRILDQMLEYKEKTKSTILLVSHSMEDVARVADRVLVMNQGEIAMFDTVKEVYSRSDELSNMGLNVPAVSKIFIGLKEKGIEIDKNVFTLDKAKDVLLPLLKGGSSK